MMKKSKGSVLLAALLTLTAASAAQAQSAEDQVREVVTTAYVEGIHIERDPAKVRAGFDETFVMSVRSDEGVSHITREEWLSRMRAGDRNPREVTHRFTDVMVVGNTATARLELFIDGNHIFTDVLGLYRFDSDWRIVNKIFERH